MREQIVHVDCYSGYKADERPMKLHLAGRALEIVAVEDRWYSPGATFFRVIVEGGDRYVLRHEEAQDVWSLSAFRAETAQTFDASHELKTDTIATSRRADGELEK